MSFVTGVGDRLVARGRSILRTSVAKFGLASSAPRGLAVLSALVLTPLLLSAVGPTIYGYWVLATIVPTLVISPDFGLGNAILNQLIATRKSRGTLASSYETLYEVSRIMRYIAFAWLLFGMAAAALYATLIDAPNQTGKSIFASLVVGLACFTLGIPATVWQRSQLALDHAHRGALWEGVGRLCALVLTIIAAALTPFLPVLVATYLLPVSVALWINAAIHKRQSYHGCPRPTRRSLRSLLNHHRALFKLGSFFVIMQVAYLLQAALDPFIVGAILGPESVAYVSATRRPFDMIPLTISLFAVALWPVFTRLDLSGSSNRLRRMLARTVGFSVLFASVLASLAFALQDSLYQVLTAGIILPESADVALLGLQATALASVLVINVYLNAVNLVKMQSILLLSGALLLLAAKLAALKLGGDVHHFIAVGSIGYVSLIAAPTWLLAALRATRPTSSHAD